MIGVNFSFLLCVMVSKESYTHNVFQKGILQMLNQILSVHYVMYIE